MGTGFVSPQYFKDKNQNQHNIIIAFSTGNRYAIFCAYWIDI